MAAVDSAVTRFWRHCRSAAKRGRQYVAPALEDRRSVIFVAGQQRSGTNMLMNALERHWRTDVYHETDARAFQRYEMRDLATIGALIARSKASHVVIKALCETQRLTALLDAFPDARALWVVRHHHDVSKSMARQFSSTADVLKRMRIDPALGGWRGERMNLEVRTQLADLVDDDISETSAAAFQWYMRNQLYFDQGLDRDPRVHLVFYEDLATQPEVAFRAVTDFIGLDFRPSMIAGVFATSVRTRDEVVIDPRIDDLCRQLLDRLTLSAKTTS